MCGICFVAYSNGTDILKCIDESRLSRRGPDGHSQKKWVINEDLNYWFGGWTLHFQGDPTTQPISDENGSSLLWNGEIFGGIQIDGNDGATLFKLLEDCSSDDEILKIVSKVLGPWAFIYHRFDQNKIWFGRDVLGRRSLLWLHSNDIIKFALSSVVIPDFGEWSEVPADGVYCIVMGDSKTELTLFPWIVRDCRFNGVEKLNNFDPPISLMENNHHNIEIGPYGIISSVGSINSDLPDEHYEKNIIKKSISNFSFNMCATDEQKSICDEFYNKLYEAVDTRVNNQSALCDVCLKDNFMDNSMTKLGINDVVENCESHSINLTNDTMNSLCNHATVAVLFSGGIDSLVIAELAHRCISIEDPIDLINVAFQQETVSKGKANRSKDVHSINFDVPDRITGCSAYEKLCELHPERKWNFIQVNVTKEELQEARTLHIRHLVYPQTSVLDDSIGCAIWFAAKGYGFMADGNHELKLCNSTARVILVGMGADEQLAGYSRHRSKFQNQGWKGLTEEIEMEIQRISSRNLGRDDRVISDHSKEARMPFLDENVVRFLSELPVYHKANLHLDRGIGDKFLLRLLAENLHLGELSKLPKRAIQFGSRIAKLENRKEKASDACSRLTEDVI